MIDIHNHILPALDDGSPDIETTEEYFKLIKEAGISHIVFTPHYMPGFYDNTRDRLDKAYNSILPIKKEIIPNVNTYYSTEVYLNGEFIVNDIIKENLFINNSKYVLVENNLNGFTEDLYHLLYQLVRKGYKPILAHPERYQEIRTDISKAEDFMIRDVYLQINTSSLLGGYGEKVQQTAFELIDRGWAHFLGSDCHCHSGVYDYPESVELIRKEFDDNIATYLSKTFPQKMLNNEHVPIFYMVRKEIPQKKSFFDKLFNLFGD